MRLRLSIIIIFDLLIVFLSFSILLYIRPGAFRIDLMKFYIPFLIFISLWLGTSFALQKYRSILSDIHLARIIKKTIFCGVIVVGLVSTLMYITRYNYYARTLVLGTIIVSTLINLIWVSLYYYLRNATYVEPSFPKTAERKFKPFITRPRKRLLTEKKAGFSREEAMLVEINIEAYDYVFDHAEIESPETLVISTTSNFNIDSQLSDTFKSIVNLKRLNDIRYLNKFLESANRKLPLGGLFIDFVETKNLRKVRILNKFPIVLNYVAYTIDYIIKRLFPKFLITKKIYFFLTKGLNRVLTKAETFGRLYSCGFEIVDEKFINNNLFFVARKISEPFYPKNPTYGPFIKLKRVGYKGKMIRVYKLRTMHPYAEYLQEYVYKTHGLQKGGKFNADFRVSNIGKILRAFWLDELPMIMNLLRRDMKIVGVRPLSEHYFSLYTEEHQRRRINYRPGLIPPFYADNPQTLEEIMQSEKRYFDAYDKNPIITDLKYFFLAFYNIVFKKYRSK